MTQNQLKLIYEYMGWKPYYSVYTDNTIYGIKFDTNYAWEVVQEMERQGNWEDFCYHSKLDLPITTTLSWYIFYLYNPDNFFKCFGEWLEQREASNGN